MLQRATLGKALPAPSARTFGRGAAYETRRARAAVPRAFQEQPPRRKRSIEELASEQNSAAEPGGAVGGQDPGPKLGGGAPRELDIDAALRSTLRPLLRSTRARLQEQEGRGATPSDIAAASLAAAEASGALPPLAGAQRSAVAGFFERLATELVEGSGSMSSFEDMGPGEQEYGVEDAALFIKPVHRELMEAVVNVHLAAGGQPRRNRGPKDSVKMGGEVGNIALQSDTHGSEEPKGYPAWSEADRAEHQAEKAFEQLELADLPHSEEPSPSDLEVQQEPWRFAAVEGDAPAAGDGLQAVDSEADARQASGTNKLSTAADQINAPKDPTGGRSDAGRRSDK
ncbi:hypothetical protein C2E20_1072 [Micractinium conductrix]|uniref:Uncharacterized protein n=1 Tax=Micractinium conductrix TaxID=554055 RepID=A0A2P6VMU6_9CHLO|nr:hypothetical protein C2E20_1072 [Micractinium conductrix]|eukprot:PSC75426.1 hypothetical protein C2E20_1072 [Micractinium conductrix]